MIKGLWAYRTPQIAANPDLQTDTSSCFQQDLLQTIYRRRERFTKTGDQRPCGLYCQPDTSTLFRIPINGETRRRCPISYWRQTKC